MSARENWPQYDVNGGGSPYRAGPLSSARDGADGEVAFIVFQFAGAEQPVD